MAADRSAWPGTMGWPTRRDSGWFVAIRFITPQPGRHERGLRILSLAIPASSRSPRASRRSSNRRPLQRAPVVSCRGLCRSRRKRVPGRRCGRQHRVREAVISEILLGNGQRAPASRRSVLAKRRPSSLPLMVGAAPDRTAQFVVRFAEHAGERGQFVADLDIQISYPDGDPGR